MDKTNIVLLGNALIWVAAITAIAVLLRGTEQGEIVIIILAGAAGASHFLVSFGLRQDRA